MDGKLRGNSEEWRVDRQRRGLTIRCFEVETGPSHLGEKKKKDANKEWGGPGCPARRSNGAAYFPATRATNRKPRSRAERPCDGCGLAGPRRVDHGALKPDQITSSASSIVKERLAAVPLAGPPRAAGVPAARGSRSAWPPRRIRDGTPQSNPRAKLRSIRCGRGVRRGARPAAHPFLSAAGNAKSRMVESKFQLRSENTFFKDLRRFIPGAALGGNRAGR